MTSASSTSGPSDAASSRERLREQFLASLHGASPKTGEALPTLGIQEDPESEQSDPFDLLDLQQAYWIGRLSGTALGNTACHAYLELEATGLDLARLEAACDALVRRHPMLRTVIGTDGRQRVLPEVPPYQVPVAEAHGPHAERILADIREEMSHQVLPADRWPLFDIRVTRITPNRFLLHVSFDVLIADAVSFRLLAAELVRLYRSPHDELPLPAMTFRDYVRYVGERRDTAEYRRAHDWWRERVPDLPMAPELPLATSLDEIDRPKFRRLETRIEPTTWKAIVAQARDQGLGSASVVLAAFAETLSLWSRSAQFTLNLTRFERPPVHPDIDQVVGPFTNNTLLGLDPTRAEDFRTFVSTVQRDMWEALEHGAVSGVEVLRELARHRGRTLMPVVFTYVQGHGDTDFRSELAELGEVVFAVSQTPQVLLDCQVSESARGVGVWWDCVDDAFTPGTLDEMFDAFTDLLTRLAEPPTWYERQPARTPPSALAARAYTERVAELPVRPLHELVDRAAREWPEHVAVIDGRRRVSYADLLQNASGLARRLCQAGVTSGDLVGVWLDRGAPQVISLLATLIAGAAYLPIDPTLPLARVRKLVELSGIRHLVAAGGADAVGEWPARLALVDPVGPTADGTVSASPVTLDDLAYVIFTSGSTGAPKGVAMQHGSVANTLLDVNSRFSVDSRDRVLGLSSIGFDLSVWDIFGTLAAGGTLVLTPSGQDAKDPARWLELLVGERVTIWNSAPALLDLLLDLPAARGVRLPELRLVLLSGDWIPLDLPERVREVAPNASVVSLGGATEAAVWSVVHEVERIAPEWHSIPYGRPLTNQTAYVLDSVGRERPIGAAGDLYLGGVGLAREYRNAPEQTGAVFVVHPTLGRLYRTGDHARRWADGTLEFLGRADRQVKIQGHRIELAEVDAALLRLPGVRAAITEAVGLRDGHRRLVGYLVCDTPPPDVAELRAQLAVALPAPLVPTQLTFVEELPLSVNGKIDRRSLSELDDHARPASLAVPDLTGIAGHVLATAQACLGDDAIRLSDDLLAAGVDSINLVRLGTALEAEFGFRPPLGEVLQRPTLAAVAELCETYILAEFARGHRLQADLVDSGGSESLITDPVDREQFRRGLVRTPPAPAGAARWPLEHGRPSGAGLVADVAMGSVNVADIRRMCTVLLAPDADDPARRGYVTPGGLALVRGFLWNRRSGIEGMAPGLHVVDPLAGDLVQLDSELALDPDAFDPFVYQDTFRRAAFAVLLVGHLPSYSSLYGRGDGGRFAAVEAGAMAQSLVTACRDGAIVLRSVPLIDSGRLDLRPWVAGGDEILHVLLGGRAHGEGPGYEEGIV